MSLRRRTRAKEMSEFRDEKFHSDDVTLRSDWLLLRTEFSRVSITSNQRPVRITVSYVIRKKSFTSNRRSRVAVNVKLITILEKPFSGIHIN